MPSSSSSSDSSTASSSQSSSQQSGQEGSQDSSQGGFESSPQVAGNQGQESGNQGNEGFENAGAQTSGDSGDQSGNQQAGTQGGQQSGAQGSQQNGGFETAGGGSQNGDDPFGDLAEGRGQVMTAAERRAALDERLNEGFAEFDGMILGERERVQAQADDAGSGVMSGGAGGGGGAGGEGQGEGEITIASAEIGGPSSTGGGVILGRPTREREFSNQNQETFPVPEDIPNGNNDDVVARQLREAAMTEPDPELRERLWDEYRAYTGLSTD